MLDLTNAPWFILLFAPILVMILSAFGIEVTLPE